MEGGAFRGFGGDLGGGAKMRGFCGELGGFGEKVRENRGLVCGAAGAAERDQATALCSFIGRPAEKHRDIGNHRARKPDHSRTLHEIIAAKCRILQKILDVDG